MTIAVILLISRHADKPCPTWNQLIECTGLPRDQAEQFLGGLKDSGMLEVEERLQRRIRLQCGPWTAWA